MSDDERAANIGDGTDPPSPNYVLTGDSIASRISVWNLASDLDEATVEMCRAAAHERHEAEVAENPLVQLFPWVGAVGQVLYEVVGHWYHQFACCASGGCVCPVSMPFEASAMAPSMKSPRSCPDSVCPETGSVYVPGDAEFESISWMIWLAHSVGVVCPFLRPKSFRNSASA